MKYVKRDREEYVFYEWRNVESVEGATQPEFVLDLDPPLPAVLFDRPDFQMSISHGNPKVQDWEFPDKEKLDGELSQIRFRYVGDNPKQYRKVHWMMLKIKHPWDPGTYFPVSAGRVNETLIEDAGREDPPEEIECPECEAYLYPVPDKCPQCGHALITAVPTAGELVEKYGADATIGTHTSYSAIEIWVTYTRTQEEADRINAEQAKKHEAKRDLYKKKMGAWHRLLAPWEQKEAAEREAQERAEFERLKNKYAEG